MKTKLIDLFHQHVNILSGEIGARPAGSAAHQKAAAYIQQCFTNYGLETEVQTYTCPDWEDLGTRLTLKGVSLEVGANPFSPACHVNAPYIMLSTIEELAAAHLAGHIAVLYGDLTKDVLSCKSWFLISEREQRMIQLLEEKQPLAIITIQTKPCILNRLIEDWEFAIPSVTVPEQSGLELLSSPDALLNLHIQSHQTHSYAANIVARKQGKLTSQIVLCAHYDTKIDTPGACDNASGTAALLVLAEVFHQKELTHLIEFVAFGSEEYLPIGEDVYLPQAEANFERTLAAINFDGISHVLGSDTVMIVSHSPSFYNLVDKIKQHYPSIVWTEPWPESNHSSFAMRGVPSIAFTSTEAKHIAHSRADAPALLSAVKAAEVILFAEEIIDNLQAYNERIRE